MNTTLGTPVDDILIGAAIILGTISLAAAIAARILWIHLLRDLRRTLDTTTNPDTQP